MLKIRTEKTVLQYSTLYDMRMLINTHPPVIKSLLEPAEADFNAKRFCILKKDHMKDCFQYSDFKGTCKTCVALTLSLL